MDNRKNDELDLLDLLIKGINIFKKNFWTIVISFILGLGLGLLYYTMSPKIYENKLIISSSILTESYGKKLIETTRNFIRERNYKALAGQLSITEEEARKIFVVRIENLSDVQIDPTKENDRYLITVRVSDQAVLPKLEQGIISYFENNDFVKVRVNQNKTYYKQVITKLEQEIKDLEELKSRIYNGEFFANVKGNVSFDPTTVNSKILELTKEKITLENELELANSVQVIEGFTTFERPVAPRALFVVFIGSMVGLAIASVIILIRVLNQLIAKAETSSK
jgi:hypothetical protein